MAKWGVWGDRAKLSCHKHSSRTPSAQRKIGKEPVTGSYLRVKRPNNAPRRPVPYITTNYCTTLLMEAAFCKKKSQIGKR